MILCDTVQIKTDVSHSQNQSYSLEFETFPTRLHSISLLHPSTVQLQHLGSYPKTFVVEPTLLSASDYKYAPQYPLGLLSIMLHSSQSFVLLLIHSGENNTWISRHTRTRLPLLLPLGFFLARKRHPSS